MHRWVPRAIEFATYDFCPQVNRYVRWLREPLGWLLIAAISAGAIGISVATQGWYLCGGIVALIVLGVVWPWLAVRGLRCELTWERSRCHEGQTVRATLIVTNRWPWPAWGLLLERGLLESHQENAPSVATSLTRVAGWSRTEYVFDFHPRRRGIYPTESPVLATGFPMGISTARRPVSVSQPLLVWPRVVPLNAEPAVAGLRPSLGQRWIDRSGDSGDILSARPYRDGDSLRHVHWIQTARRDTLIVAERQAASQRRLTLTLDDKAFECAGDEQQRDALDVSLRVYASIAGALLARGSELYVELAGKRRRLGPAGGSWERLLDELATYGVPLVRPSGEAGARAMKETTATAASAAMTSPFPRGSGDGDSRLVVTTFARWRESTGSTNRVRRDPTQYLTLADPLTTVVPREDALPWQHESPWLTFDQSDDSLQHFAQCWEQRCHADEQCV